MSEPVDIILRGHNLAKCFRFDSPNRKLVKNLCGEIGRLREREVVARGLIDDLMRMTQAHWTPEHNAPILARIDRYSNRV